MLPPGERPQITNATRFQLAYDVDAVGPSGVAEVQLWATSDGGQTWRLWGTDDDLQSPFEVVVDQPGIYGFHVVVVSRNGLAGRKPRGGDLADIWIGVDTTSPDARLTAAVYGDGANAGKLFIRWEATDLNLGDRPDHAEVRRECGRPLDGDCFRPAEQRRIRLAGGPPTPGQRLLAARGTR